MMLQSNTPHKPRLLIMDEDRIILQSLCQFLRREGYDVRTCDTGADAFNTLEGHPVELLLADVYMPGVKGGEIVCHPSHTSRNRPGSPSLASISVMASTSRQASELLPPAGQYFPRP